MADEIIKGEIIPYSDGSLAVSPITGRSLAPFEMGLLQASIKAEFDESGRAFNRWFNGLSASTGEQYRKGIRAFCAYLSDSHDLDIDQKYFHGWDSAAGAVPANFRPDGWELVSYGLVIQFRDWLLDSGYAIATVNSFTNAIKQFAKVATDSQLMSFETGYRINGITKLKSGHAKNIDTGRTSTRITERTYTRNGQTITRAYTQKTKEIEFSDEIARGLAKKPFNDAMGQRDRLMLLLMIDHGLRASEVALLTVANFKLGIGVLDFYRPKVKRDAKIILSTGTLEAARRFLNEAGKGQNRPVFVGGNKSRELAGKQLTRHDISRIVNSYGRKLSTDNDLAELEQLGSHDLRHYWATLEARKGTPVDKLQHAGGWSSPAMPLRYIARSKYDNEGTAAIVGRDYP